MLVGCYVSGIIVDLGVGNSVYINLQFTPTEYMKQHNHAFWVFTFVFLLELQNSAYEITGLRNMKYVLFITWIAVRVKILALYFCHWLTL